MECLSGCKVPREHLATCPDPGACRGCLPREAAEPTLVCRGCRARAHDALLRLPDLVEHVRAHVVPGSASDSVHVRGTRTPPAPLSLAAVDDADALHAMLAAWCTEVMDGRDLTGPSWRGTLVLPASKRTHAAGRHGRGCRRCRCFHTPGRHIGPHRARCTGVTCAGCGHAYDPARAFGLTIGGPLATDAGPTSELVAWIRPHLDWVLAQPWADDFITEVTGTVAAVGSRWPWEERPVRCAAPCPACDRLTLVRFAPRFFTGLVSIRCEAADCGEHLPEQLYSHYVRVLADTTGGAA